MVFDLNTTFKYGIYDGYTLEEVMDKDFEYVSDQIKNNPLFSLGTEAREKYYILIARKIKNKRAQFDY